MSEFLSFLQALPLFGLFNLCLEGTEQSIERLLIVVVICPMSEVPNMPRPARSPNG